MKLFNKDSLIVTLMVLVALAIFQFVFDLPILNSFKDAFTDLSITDNGLVQVRKGQYKIADTNIVIINTKGLSLKAVKSITDTLTTNKAKVIAINYSTYQSEPNYNDITNELINNSLVVLGSRINNFSNKSKNMYYSNVGDGDSNHIVRDFAPFTSYNNKIYKSFYSRIIEKYNSDYFNQLVSRENSEEVINFRGNYTQFYFLEATEILNNEFEPSIIAGKIVILGSCGVNESFKELNDYYFTPLNDEPMGRSMPDMYLPEIQANAISMIINDNYVYSVPLWTSVIIALILIYMNFTMFLYIIEKKESLYELVSLIIFLVESFILLLLDVQLFRVFNIESGLTVSLITLAIGLLLFEIYTESIVPIYLLVKQKRSKS